MNSMDPFEDKLSPEPMDVPPAKPMPTPQVVDSTEQVSLVSSDTCASLLLTFLIDFMGT